MANDLNTIANMIKGRMAFTVVLLFAIMVEPCAYAATSPVVDASTLMGKVMCGYQGWFNREGDGAERGWVHWTKGRGSPGPATAKIDLWPDVSDSIGSSAGAD